MLLLQSLPRGFRIPVGEVNQTSYMNERTCFLINYSVCCSLILCREWVAALIPVFWLLDFIECKMMALTLLVVKTSLTRSAQVSFGLHQIDDSSTNFLPLDLGVFVYHFYCLSIGFLSYITFHRHLQGTRTVNSRWAGSFSHVVDSKWQPYANFLLLKKHVFQVELQGISKHIRWQPSNNEVIEHEFRNGLVGTKFLLGYCLLEYA